MKQSARVLVVDDERFFREAIGDVLAEGDIAYVCAATAAEAENLAREPDIGVVVLDIELPDKNGLELFRELREQRPELRVIVRSAHGSQEYVLEALRLGAFDYLAKPIHEEELRLTVRRALESHRVSADWSRLRGRLSKLAGTLTTMWERARRGPDGGQALREAAVDAASEVARAARTSLLLMDEEGLQLRVAAVIGADVPAEQMEPVAFGEGVAGFVIAKGRPVVVRDAARDERFTERARPDRYRSSSFVAVPLIADDAAFGLLCATDRVDGEPFDAEDVALLQILTAQIAQLLHVSLLADRPPAPAPPASADLVDAAFEAEVPEAELAQGIAEAMTARLESPETLGRALAEAARLLGASLVSIHLAREGDAGLAREAEGDDGLRSDRDVLPTGRGLTGTAFETGQVMACGQPAEDPRFDATVDTAADGGVAPLLCGPVRFRGKTLGVFRAFFEPGVLPAARTGELLSATLSAAVRQTLLYRSLIDSIDELAQARRDPGASRSGGGGSAA